VRGGVDGLPSPHPIADTLPAMLREDAFARELCGAVDEVLAPVLLSLDGYAAHLDPALAPDDVLPWLARWVGLDVDPGASPVRHRAELQAAVGVNAARGTRRGIELALNAALGLPVAVTDSGGSRWSARPGSALPGEPEPSVVVTIQVPVGRQVDPHRVDTLLRGAVPAHLRRTVVLEQLVGEQMEDDQPEGTEGPRPQAGPRGQEEDR
jgi:phage tail-like protein